MDEDTTVRGRELGEGLRNALQSAGLPGKEVARRLGWSPSKVSRLLTGKRGTTEVDVAAVLALCGTTGHERKRMLELCREMNNHGWLQQFGGPLPQQLRTLIDHEDKAVSYQQFQPTVIPGLLQTGDYGHAMLSRSANVVPEEIDDRVATRLSRQNLFSRHNAPEFAFYIHEFALRLPVGGADVMSDQLHHLLRMAVRRNVTIRIVPAAVGAHAATAGPFILMEFAAFSPIVYLDSQTCCLFLETANEITAYRRILTALAETALDEGDSKELIAALATDLYEPARGR